MKHSERESILVYLSMPVIWAQAGCTWLRRKVRPAIAMLVAVALLLLVMPLTVFAMQIFIKVTVDTGTAYYTFEVEPSDRVEDLKAKIYDQTGIAVSEQILTFNGETLIDGDVLQDYSIQKDSILQLRTLHKNHCICGGVEMDGEHTCADVSWIPVSTFDELKSMEDGENYYLTNDVTLDGHLDFVHSINLCLNGYRINTQDKSIFVNKTLNIVSCLDGAVIQRTDGTRDNLFTVLSNGSFNVYNIAIDGGAVWGGTVDSVLQRGTTNNGVSSNGVLLEVYGTATLNAGTVLQNNCVKSSVTGTGGAVTVYGVLTINGAIIRNNANLGENGGAIKLYGSANLEMISGEIYGNSALKHGGAIQVCGYYGHAAFTMNGGTIRNNKANGVGGAVAVSNYSEFVMSGGSIINNGNTDSQKRGGGVGFVDKNTGMSVSGSAVISGNKIGDTENNLYIGSNSCNVLVVGEMDDAADIGVTMVYGTGVFTSGGADHYESFKSDNAAYTVMFVGDDLKIDAHNSHSFRYTVSKENESQLIQMCTCGHTETVTLQSDENAYKYTGSPITPVTANYSDGWSGDKNTEIRYESNTNVGTAKAILTIDDKTIEKTFEIVTADAPVITFPEAVNSINYGQPMKDAGLTFTSNAYGTFNWVAPTGIANAGVAGYAVDFKPYDHLLCNYDWASLDGKNGLQWIESRNALCTVVTVTVNRADATYIAPTVNDLTYNRTAQHLVTAGTVNGGTMEYALGTDSATAPTTGWSVAIPEGQNAGTYYVWYKVVGDSNHNDVTPACVSVTVAKKNISSAVVYCGTQYFTGEPRETDVVVVLDGVALEASDYELAHLDNVNVGTAKVVTTGVGNYTGTATGHFEIEYFPLDGDESAIVNGTVGADGWRIGEVTLVAPAEFLISASPDGPWYAAISVNAEQDGKATYYLKNRLLSYVGQKTLSLKIDLNDPTAQISVGEIKWNSFLNTITFGLFFKETQSVTIDVNDTMSGVAKIEYLITTEEITDPASVVWEEYNGTFNIQPNSKNVIYAKVTDYSGRYTIVNTDGIVLYTDSEAMDVEKTYNLASNDDVEFKLDLNGNDIDWVACGNGRLSELDYSQTEDGIVIYADYIKNALLSGRHDFTVYFKPVGESFNYGVDWGVAYETKGDTPNTAMLVLNVELADRELEITNDISKTYDGTPVSEPEYTMNGAGGVTFEYKLRDADDSTYTTVKPVDAGEYTVRVSVAEHGIYGTDVETADFEIAKKSVTVTATAPNKVYDGTNEIDKLAIVLEFGGLINGESVGFTIKESWYNGASAGEDKRVPIVFNVTGDAAENYTFPTGSEYEAPNYYVEALADITSKEIGINWDATRFLPYDGTSKVPNAYATGLIDGDTCTLINEVVETTEGAGVIPGNWTAKVTALSNPNYKLPANGKLVSVPFQIVNGYQNYAPNVSGVNETVDGKADGKITGVDSTMEYRKEGETTYTAISGSEVQNLEDGIYYVRYAAKTYYNPSPDKQVTIGVGRKLAVIVPQNQIGYTLAVDKTEIEYMGGPTITLIIHDGYSKTENFAVKLNGTDMQWGDFTQIGTQSCAEDVVITVEGIADISAPSAEVSIKNNKWTSFWNGTTFGLFFNETQDVTISATDTGSGVNTVQYYLASGELELDEVTQITGWQDYNGTFQVNPDNKYVVYAKVTDNTGNVLYLNSDGVILDKTAAVIDGVENGESYWGDTTVTVTDALAGVKEVKVDGSAVALDNGKFTIIADNAEHIVAVTDKAGNVTEYKIMVYKNYTVTYKVDGNAVSTQTVGHGKDAVAPAIPAKDGYTQTAPAWDKDGTNITADTEINAVYTSNKYTVTFTADGKVLGTVEVEHGKDVEIPATPAKDGYTAKWDHDGKCITADTTITVIYTLIPTTPATVDTFDLVLWATVMAVSAVAPAVLLIQQKKRKTQA